MNGNGKRLVKAAQRNWNIWGKNFAREAEGLWLGASSLTYEELLMALRRIEKKYLAECDLDAKAKLEMRRRVCEYELEFALSHERQLTVCRRKFNQCASLGFTDAFREAHFRLRYAESVARRGHLNAARTMIRGAVASLDLNSKDERLNKDQVRTYKRWADRIVRSLESHSVHTS